MGQFGQTVHLHLKQIETHGQYFCQCIINHHSASVHHVIGLTAWLTSQRQVTFAKVRGRSLIQSAKTELGLTLAVNLLQTTQTDILVITIKLSASGFANGRKSPAFPKPSPGPKLHVHHSYSACSNGFEWDILGVQWEQLDAAWKLLWPPHARSSAKKPAMQATSSDKCQVVTQTEVQWHCPAFISVQGLCRWHSQNGWSSRKRPGQPRADTELHRTNCWPSANALSTTVTHHQIALSQSWKLRPLCVHQRHVGCQSAQWPPWPLWSRFMELASMFLHFLSHLHLRISRISLPTFDTMNLLHPNLQQRAPPNHVGHKVSTAKIKLAHRDTLSECGKSHSTKQRAARFWKFSAIWRFPKMGVPLNHPL